MSLRGRLLIALVALLTVGLLVADAATYLQLREFLLDQTDNQLEQAASNGSTRDLGGPTGPGGPGGGGRRDRGRVQSEGLDGMLVGTLTSGTSISWHRGDYPTVVPDAPPDVSPTVIELAQAAGTTSLGPTDVTTRLTVSSADGQVSYRVLIAAEDDGDVVIVAVPLTVIDNTLARLLAIEMIVTLFVIAASVGIGTWLVRVGLHPLDDIGGTAAEIAAGDLSRRVEHVDERTEVGRLGTSLNTMLGQIETAFEERHASEQALRQSEERLRRFVADASHELRTPLAAVQAYAELFERGASRHPEDLPRLMQNIHKESARMAVLIDDLLLLTRLDQGRPLDRKPVDLAAIAADAVEAARVLDPSRAITLVTDDSVEVAGDRVRLRQIADNLLANTRIHTPPGTPIEVHVHAIDGAGVLAVADHGPGLTPEQSTNVFERFYRADESRARADGGTGLGLSIVAAIAQAHDGAADVQPTPGGGATFRIRIPLLDPAT